MAINQTDFDRMRAAHVRDVVVQAMLDKIKEIIPSMDAQKWAEGYERVARDMHVFGDKEYLKIWFAHALMCGRTFGVNDSEHSDH